MFNAYYRKFIIQFTKLLLIVERLNIMCLILTYHKGIGIKENDNFLIEGDIFIRARQPRIREINFLQFYQLLV